MIRIEHHEGVYAPLCVCDICGKRITDARQAMALYPNPGGPGAGERVEVLHVHKGKCDTLATNSYGDDGGTDELSTHLFYLLKNVGLNGGTPSE